MPRDDPRQEAVSQYVLNMLVLMVGFLLFRHTGAFCCLGSLRVVQVELAVVYLSSCLRAGLT